MTTGNILGNVHGVEAHINLLLRDLFWTALINPLLPQPIYAVMADERSDPGGDPLSWIAYTRMNTVSGREGVGRVKLWRVDAIKLSMLWGNSTFIPVVDSECTTWSNASLLDWNFNPHTELGNGCNAITCLPVVWTLPSIYSNPLAPHEHIYFLTVSADGDDSSIRDIGYDYCVWAGILDDTYDPFGAGSELQGLWLQAFDGHRPDTSLLSQEAIFTEPPARFPAVLGEMFLRGDRPI